MIAQAGAVLRLPVLYRPHRPAARLAAFPCWQSIALVATRHRKLVIPLTFAATVARFPGRSRSGPLSTVRK
jgi:hypothetical protein